MKLLEFGLARVPSTVPFNVSSHNIENVAGAGRVWYLADRSLHGKLAAAFSAVNRS